MNVVYNASDTCSRFHLDRSFVRGLVGPIGSGKSVACCTELMELAHEQAPGPDGIRRSRWAIIRNTYRELNDTTMQTWFDWFPKQIGVWDAGNMKFTVEANDIHAEFMFRALDRPDDVKKLLSLELTGAWVNEARELPMAVIDMLQGRVGRYPSKAVHGAQPTYYGIIMDTNPPDTDHWWYYHFEENHTEGWAVFHQPSGLSDEAENRNNLPADYYERLMAGKDEQWVQAYVHGQYAFVRDGKPVYPMYNDTIHCARELLVPNPDWPTYIGLDFGLTPAAALFQRTPLGQYRVFDEIVTDDMAAFEFGGLIQRLLGESYPDLKIERITGDPAGDERAQTDKKTPFQVLRTDGVMAQPASTNDVEVRRKTVTRHLAKMTMMGEPALLISPKCKMLRKGMAGGFKYKRLQVRGHERYEDKPDKGRYSHICEALEYGLLGCGEGDRVIGIPQNRRKPTVKRAARIQL